MALARDADLGGSRHVDVRRRPWWLWGAWEWTPVARQIRARGHEVFTPTLTGMGERAHLAGPHIGLGTHIQDVVAAIEMEDLHDVVLCAHSYGGVPATGAADRVTERIRLLIYIDALVPPDGQSALDLLPERSGPEARATAVERGLVPMPVILEPPQGWVGEAERLGYIRRLRPQPLSSFSEPIRLSGAVDRVPAALCAVRKRRRQGIPLLRSPSALALADGHIESWPPRTTHSSSTPTRRYVLHELASSIPRATA